MYLNKFQTIIDKDLVESNTNNQVIENYVKTLDQMERGKIERKKAELVNKINKKLTKLRTKFKYTNDYDYRKKRSNSLEEKDDRYGILYHEPKINI